MAFGFKLPVNPVGEGTMTHAKVIPTQRTVPLMLCPHCLSFANQRTALESVTNPKQVTLNFDARLRENVCCLKLF